LNGWIDDSDSMIYEESGARKKTLIQFVDHITEIYSMANEPGILAIAFTNPEGGLQNCIYWKVARIPGSPQLWWCEKDRNCG